MDITRDPRNASTDQLVKRATNLGADIRYGRRRFIACLPEINRRKLWKRFGHQSIFLMASHVAEYSTATTRRILNTADRIQPFVAVRRLFESSNIGWSKFEKISTVINRDNAGEILKLLKSATYQAIKRYVDDIEAEEEAKKKREQEKEKEKEKETQDNSDDESGDSDTKETAIVGATRSGVLFPPKPDSESEDSGGADETKTNETNEGKITIGKLVNQGGVQVVTLTLYPRVAERLMQKVDKLGKYYSRVAGVSKIVEHLLNECETDLVADKDALFRKPKKKKKEHSTDVVFWEKEANSYWARTRFGPVTVNLAELKECNANYDTPINLNEMALKAEEAAIEYEEKKKAEGKELGRYRPPLVDKFMLYRSGGGFCEHPGCNERGECHHIDRFSVKKTCRPSRMVNACEGHHDLKHSGLEKYDELSDLLDENHRRAAARVDAKYRQMRRQSFARKGRR